MARISDRLVVQLVDDRLVIVDAVGQEIIVRDDEQDAFIAACLYLHEQAAVVHAPCKARWTNEQWAAAAPGGG